MVLEAQASKLQEDAIKQKEAAEEQTSLIMNSERVYTATTPFNYTHITTTGPGTMTSTVNRIGIAIATGSTTPTSKLTYGYP